MVNVEMCYNLIFYRYLLETFTGHIPNGMPFYRMAMPTACNIQSRRDLLSVKTYTLSDLTSLRDVPETRIVK